MLTDAGGGGGGSSSSSQLAKRIETDGMAARLTAVESASRQRNDGQTFNGCADEQLVEGRPCGRLVVGNDAVRRPPRAVDDSAQLKRTVHVSDARSSSKSKLAPKKSISFASFALTTVSFLHALAAPTDHIIICSQQSPQVARNSSAVPHQSTRSRNMTAVRPQAGPTNTGLAADPSRFARNTATANTGDMKRAIISRTRAGQAKGGVK
uniref:Uncharacterized protein n=1 Tax=Plectus sambesii TaxID=2011161 RepID=A0A914W124_9BILA